jgi:hypothetical protein
MFLKEIILDEKKITKFLDNKETIQVLDLKSFSYNQNSLLMYHSFIVKKKFILKFNDEALVKVKSYFDSINHTYKCLDCNVNFEEKNKKRIACCNCFNLFHYQCVNITAKNPKWLCSVCEISS